MSSHISLLPSFPSSHSSYEGAPAIVFQIIAAWKSVVPVSCLVCIFLTFYFKIIIDSNDVAKTYKEILYPFYPASPNSKLLFTTYDRTPSKPGNQHWYNPQNLFRFYQIYKFLFECGYSFI